MGGKDVRFTADYSVATRVQRKACYPVMEKARKAGFQVFLVYPATVKVSKGHDHNFFEDPAKLELFLLSHYAKDTCSPTGNNLTDGTTDSTVDEWNVFVV